jgi:hypothetical protein
VTTPRTTLLVSAALAATLALPALAAPPAPAPAAAPPSRIRFGLGVSFVPVDAAGTLSTIEVYLPIAISETIRLEPSLGIFTENSGGNGLDTSDFTIGLGVLGVSRVGPSTNLTYGGRLKINFAGVDDPTPGGTSDSGTDLTLAGAFGGEQYLADRLSIGLEAQLGYYSLSDVSGDASGVFTTGLVFLRVWF